jgi:hypothetical protein
MLKVLIIIVVILNASLAYKFAPEMKSLDLTLAYVAGLTLGFPFVVLVISQIWTKYQNTGSRVKALFYSSLVILIINLSGFVLNSNTMTLSDQISQDAAELNRKLPNKNNPENVLEKVIVEGETLVYLYRFPNYEAEEISIQPNQKESMLSAMCANGKNTLASGANIQFRYHNKDWKVIEQISIDSKMCDAE